MNTLHLLRSSPFADDQFAQCLTTTSPDDTLILLDDGCYALNHQLLEQANAQDITLHIIDTHRKARGLDNSVGVNAISMSELVAYTLKHNRVITWQ